MRAAAGFPRKTLILLGFGVSQRCFTLYRTTLSAPEPRSACSMATGFHTYRNLPLSVHLLCAGTLISRMGAFIGVFMAIYISDELGFGNAFATQCIGLFGLGGVVLSLTVFPLLVVLPLGKYRRERLSRALLSWLFRRYVAFMDLTGLLAVRMDDPDALNRGGQLIVANHPCLLDVVFLIALVRNANCLVKKSMWYNPFTAFTVRATGYIRNDADDVLGACSAALAAGDNLIVFPEGTRTHPERPFKFQRGAANIALAAGSDLSPVTIHTAPSRLLKGQPWYRQATERMMVTIRQFPPLAIGPYLQSGAPRSKLARQITRDLEQFYREQ